MLYICVALRGFMPLGGKRGDTLRTERQAPSLSLALSLPPENTKISRCRETTAIYKGSHTNYTHGENKLVRPPQKTALGKAHGKSTRDRLGVRPSMFQVSRSSTKHKAKPCSLSPVAMHPLTRVTVPIAAAAADDDAAIPTPAEGLHENTPSRKRLFAKRACSWEFK